MESGQQMRRLDFVDSLRGGAALYVMLMHMTALPPLAVPQWAKGMVLSGGSAVGLFFIISAFSLCYTMNRHLGVPGETRAFYVRRLFRIAPLFYALLAFYAVWGAVAYHIEYSPWEVAKSICFIFNFFPGSEQGIVSGSWTIGVEMIFYAVFPLLFWQFRDVPGLFALFFGSLFLGAIFQEITGNLSLSGNEQSLFYNFSIFHFLPVFALGMLCWRLYHRHVSRQSHPAAIGGALILGSLWTYHMLLNGEIDFGFRDAWLWYGIIYSGLMLGLAIFPSRIFVNPLTRYAGRVSYSVYLIHPVVITFLTPVYFQIYRAGLPIWISFLSCAGTTATIVLAVAGITYRLIERPGMDLGKRLLARWSAPAVLPAETASTAE
jgi:peptidoglycan/LPS O-acetylase OafA/YrhL